MTLPPHARCAASSGTSKLRRYQQARWNPVSPMPLMAHSGAYGTVIFSGHSGTSAGSRQRRS
jgi:hypothetical protein